MAKAESRKVLLARALLALAGGCLAGVLLWKVPQWQVDPWRALLPHRDLLVLENDLRQTLLLTLAGAALMATLYLVWRRTVATENTTAAMARTLFAAQEGQRTECVSRAIEQLADNRLEIRLGGIYTLERLARESEADHWPIMEVLCAFVRERAAWAEERELSATAAADVQAVLTVLGRRMRSHEKREEQRLDLRRTDLRGVDLSDLHLERACLLEAHLEGADLQGLHLEGADLRRAYLTNADMVEANLKGADLREAHLESAYLVEAHLEGADLGGAHLEGAYLGGAFLEGADLGGAHLDGAYIYKAHLEGASLHGARILTAIGMNREEREQINRTASEEPVAVRPRKRRGQPPHAPVEAEEPAQRPRRERA